MAIETRAPISRRGLLAALATGTAAAIAGTVAGVERALAAGSDGETVVIGGIYDDVRSTTRLKNTATEEPVLRIVASPPSSSGLPTEMSLDVGPRGMHVRSSGFRTGSAIEIGRGIDVHSGGSASTPTRYAISGQADLLGVRGTGRTGVEGIGVRGPGVRGRGSRGGDFVGTAAQVRLKPSSEASHPGRGRRGDLFVDKGGRLWYCKGSTNWHQLA